MVTTMLGGVLLISAAVSAVGAYRVYREGNRVRSQLTKRCLLAGGIGMAAAMVLALIVHGGS